MSRYRPRNASGSPRWARPTVPSIRHMMGHTRARLRTKYEISAPGPIFRGLFLAPYEHRDTERTTGAPRAPPDRGVRRFAPRRAGAGHRGPPAGGPAAGPDHGGLGRPPERRGVALRRRRGHRGDRFRPGRQRTPDGGRRADGPQRAALGLPVAPGPDRPRADRGGAGSSGRAARRRGGHPGRELIQRHAPDGRLDRGAARPSRAGPGHDRAVAPSGMPACARAAARTSSMTTSSGIAVESITRWYSAGSAGSVRYRRRTYAVRALSAARRRSR